MPIAATIARLSALHAKHKTRSLSDEERAEYEELRDEVSSMLVRAQRLVIRPGQTQRQALRVASAKKLELTIAGKLHSTITLDLGAHGFAALLGAPVAVGTTGDFALKIGSEAIRGAARVVASSRHGSSMSSHRTSFFIERIAEADQERLENIVLDAALAAFTG